jgi:glycosyltransferase involved in cell wall biosynthesis
MDRIAAVIPAYNEEDSIAQVVHTVCTVAQANRFSMDAIVINDCSSDRTAEIIDALPCIALHLPVNLGIGGAVQTGFRYAFENNYDFAVQVDGDGQHPAEEITKLLHEMKARNLDVAIGSRFIDKEGFQSSRLRRAGILWFRWLNGFLADVDIRDSTSGFRMLNRKALALVNEYYPDEYPEPEAIILYAKNHLKIGEVAVTMKARQGGISSIGFFTAVYYMWKVTLAIFFTFIRLTTNKS